MIAGPLGGYCIKKFDNWVDGKIKSGFEMLVNNFSAGIIGMILAILAFLGIGPAVEVLSKILAAGVNFMVAHDMLPLASIFVEPAKILFLNNAINHGIFSPLGIQPVSYTHLVVTILDDRGNHPLLRRLAQHRAHQGLFNMDFARKIAHPPRIVAEQSLHLMPDRLLLVGKPGFMLRQMQPAVMTVD